MRATKEKERYADVTKGEGTKFMVAVLLRQ